MARRYVQVHVLEDRLVLEVVEPDGLEAHITADHLDIPAAGAVGDLGLDVHQLEDARSRGHGALEGAVLHGEVQHRLEESLDPEGEGDQDAHFDGVVQHQGASEDNDEGEAEGGQELDRGEEHGLHPDRLEIGAEVL